MKKQDLKGAKSLGKGKWRIQVDNPFKFPPKMDKKYEWEQLKLGYQVAKEEMKKLEEEVGWIDEEVKIEMLTRKNKELKEPEVPIIPFKETEAPLNILLLEHYWNELKQRFLADDAPKQFKVVKDECIDKIKAPNLYQFWDKYLNPKMMQKVDTKRLELISRNQFDNVEL